MTPLISFSFKSMGSIQLSTEFYPTTTWKYESPEVSSTRRDVGRYPVYCILAFLLPVVRP